MSSARGAFHASAAVGEGFPGSAVGRVQETEETVLVSGWKHSSSDEVRMVQMPTRGICVRSIVNVQNALRNRCHPPLRSLWESDCHEHGLRYRRGGCRIFHNSDEGAGS